MNQRRTYYIQKRIIISEFDEELSIFCPPKRKIKYLFLFLFCLVLTSFAPIYLFFHNDIFPYFGIDEDENSIASSIFQLSLPFALLGIYPTIKLFINGIVKNFFLKEELIINNTVIRYIRYGTVRFTFKYETINSIMFYGVKEKDQYTEIFSAYKAMVAINNDADGKINKILTSISNKESDLMFKVIHEKLHELKKNIRTIQNAIIFVDNNPDYNWERYSYKLYH